MVEHSTADREVTGSIPVAPFHLFFSFFFLFSKFIVDLATALAPFDLLFYFSINLYLRDAILAFKSMTGQEPNYLGSKLPIVSPEGTSAVGRPDHLPSLIYRFLKLSRHRDLFITEL